VAITGSLRTSPHSPKPLLDVARGGLPRSGTEHRAGGGESQQVAGVDDPARQGSGPGEGHEEGVGSGRQARRPDEGIAGGQGRGRHVRGEDGERRRGRREAPHTDPGEAVHEERHGIPPRTAEPGACPGWEDGAEVDVDGRRGCGIRRNDLDIGLLARDEGCLIDAQPKRDRRRGWWKR
jgi:hypothetical protein